MNKTWYLTLTLACHSHNGFAKVGGAGFLTKKEMQTSFNQAVEDKDSEFLFDGSDFQFLLDKNGTELADVLETKQITKEQAEQLTGDRWDDMVIAGLEQLKEIQPGSFNYDSLRPNK